MKTETKMTHATEAAVEALRKKVSKHWVKITEESGPPLDSNVLIKVSLGKKDPQVMIYSGRFFNDKDGLAVHLGHGWPIPYRQWESNGIVAWMPLPK